MFYRRGGHNSRMYMRAFDPNVLPVLVLPSYLISHENEWLAGIALGGILLSLIGSIGGLSLGIGTMIARDMAGEIFHIKNDKMLLRITKGAVLAVLIAASLVSAANAGSQVLFWNYLSMALRGGGIFLPLSLAIFRPGLIPKSWALASMLLSTSHFLPCLFRQSSLRRSRGLRGSSRGGISVRKNAEMKNS